MKRKPAVIFLSGWALGPGVWFLQEKYFSADRAIMVSYHSGVEEASRDGQGPSLYGLNALKAINRETEDPMVLTGWSLGALVALELALLMPEKIKSLVLIGGTSRFTQAPDYHGGLPRVLVERMKKSLTRNPGQTLEKFFSLMFTSQEREEGIMEQFQKGYLSPGQNWSEKELAAGLDFLINQDLREKLGKIKVPSLIIHGDRDEICPPAAACYLHAQLKNSQLQMLPGCGHVPFLSKAEVFNEIVRRWLDDLH